MFLSLVQFMMMYVWKEYYQRQVGAEKSFGKYYLQFLPVFPEYILICMATNYPNLLIAIPS